ncbi:MAG: hypothetical protein K2K14_06650 [Ruminococcus sp.]|nr:hypothetical protein [Ruminococcus sp.]
MKTNFISSRKMAIINIITSCAIAIVSAVLINNPEARVLLIAITVANIGFIFLSKFYWKQYDNGMPYNPDLNIKIANFFEIALKYVPLLVKYCVIAIIPTALFENNYTSFIYMIIMVIVIFLFSVETILFFLKKHD